MRRSRRRAQVRAARSRHLFPIASAHAAAHVAARTVVYGFEGVFDVCYKVKLDNGLYKEAVPEEEISGAVTSDMGDIFDGWG